MKKDIALLLFTVAAGFGLLTFARGLPFPENLTSRSMDELLTIVEQDPYIVVLGALVVVGWGALAVMVTAAFRNMWARLNIALEESKLEREVARPVASKNEDKAEKMRRKRKATPSDPRCTVTLTVVAADR